MHSTREVYSTAWLLSQQYGEGASEYALKQVVEHAMSRHMHLAEFWLRKSRAAEILEGGRPAAPAQLIAGYERMIAMSQLLPRRLHPPARGR